MKENKKRRIDFMNISEIEKDFSEFCESHLCMFCPYSPILSKEGCAIHYAAEEVEFFDVDKWAYEIYGLFLKDKYAEVRVLYNITLVAIREKNSHLAKKIGMAKCGKNDYFDDVIGVAIAYCRAKGIKIPKEIYQ